MLRAFGALAISNLLLLFVAAFLGFVADVSTQTNQHVLAAVIALILTCLVQVVLFTYLTVTGKLIAQAIHLGNLSLSALDRAKIVKKTTIRYLAVIMLCVVSATATGAANWSAGEATGVHRAVAIIMLIVIIFAYYRQTGLVYENSQILDATLSAYRRYKARRRTSEPADAVRPP